MYQLSGSLAYDTILTHGGAFHARILPESIARLNVAFGVSDMAEEFGGTAGNIAYNAALLGDAPQLVGSVGYDGERYRKHLVGRGIDVSGIRMHDHLPTAHAWLLTDMENNQITAFHEGAMDIVPQVADPAGAPDLWHIAPDNHETMVTLASLAIQHGKQFFFDPGQALPGLLEGKGERILPLKEVLAQATGIFVNEYEAALLVERLRCPLEKWIKDGNHFIVRTLGARGLELITIEGTTLVPALKPSRVVDPTGCGDALRAGFLHGYVRHRTYWDCAVIGSCLASFAVETSGGQKHAPTLFEIESRAGMRLQPRWPAAHV